MQDMFSFNANINNFQCYNFFFCKNKFFQYFMDWRKTACGPALTGACSIRNKSMGFVVESDSTEGKDSSTDNMMHVGREWRYNSKALHADEC